jgi:hypothetical protein
MRASAGRPNRQRREQQDLSARFAGLWDRLQIWLAVVVFAVLLLEAFEPSRRFLDRYAFVLDQQSLIAIVALIVGVNFLVMRQMGEHLGLLRRRLEPVPELEIIQDHSMVYPRLRDRLNNPLSGQPRKLEVLGLTLYSAWPQLSVWLAGDELRDWRIVLYAVSPSYIRSHADVFPGGWAEEAEGIQDQIRKFPKVHDLSARRLKLELNCYASFPAIHGFRIGQELSASFVHWSGKDDAILRPFQFYEHFAAADRSPRAERYRKLFDNWITRAARTAETQVIDLAATERRSPAR